MNRSDLLRATGDLALALLSIVCFAVFMLAC